MLHGHVTPKTQLKAEERRREMQESLRNDPNQALYTAAERGDVEGAEKSIRQGAIGLDGALSVAAWKGHVKVVEALLAKLKPPDPVEPPEAKQKTRRIMLRPSFLGEPP